MKFELSVQKRNFLNNGMLRYKHTGNFSFADRVNKNWILCDNMLLATNTAYYASVQVYNPTNYCKFVPIIKSGTLCKTSTEVDSDIFGTIVEDYYCVNQCEVELPSIEVNRTKQNNWVVVYEYSSDKKTFKIIDYVLKDERLDYIDETQHLMFNLYYMMTIAKSANTSGTCWYNKLTTEHTLPKVLSFHNIYGWYMGVACIA